MKYEAISKYSATFSVRKMCKVLELDSSNYYRWKRAEEKRKQKLSDELKLVKQVEKVFYDSDKTYGYRAMQSALKNEGIVISEYKIRRIMRENGFYPETVKKYKPTHNGKTDGKYHKNLLQQNFVAIKCWKNMRLQVV